ncbi:MAG: hypothetical protein KGZ93_06115 [Actinobacteria bacterium]|nr:hypothetical protein [Actinomycetota bacterium]
MRISGNETVDDLGAAGTYTLRWDLVEELVTWFSSKGVATRNISVSVN